MNNLINSEAIAETIASELAKQLGPLAQQVGQKLAGASKPRRGRPPASASAAVPGAKRRGRPPKAKVEAAATGDAPPKRRGRPPKAKVEVPANGTVAEKTEADTTSELS
jgi:hypothetical protein